MDLDVFCTGLVKQLETNKIKLMESGQDEQLFGGEFKKEMNQHAKSKIIDILAETGIENKKLDQLLRKALKTICRMKLSMMAHPDHTEGSEFDDFTSYAQEVEDEIELFLKM